MTKTILFIDDNTEMLENTSELLELSNYKVFTASNGKDGIKIAKKENPNLIICDVMMPGLDGYEVLHILSQDPKTQTIPFIFLTAKSGKSDFRKGMNLGADDYLTKPFEEMDLLSTIERKLKKFEQRIGTTHKELNLSELISQAPVKIFKAKEKIFYESEMPSFVFYIVEGEVKSWKIDAYGKELITNIYGKNKFIGYTAVIEETPYEHSASTLKDSKLAAIPKATFLEWINNNQEASSYFLKKMAKALVDTNKKLLTPSYGSLRERVAQALINISNANSNDDTKTGVTFTIEYSREDLSNLVGTATESLIRVLKEFKDDKIINIEKRKIEIVDFFALKKISLG